jgi:Fe-S cluster assembly protein SufD
MESDIIARFKDTDMWSESGKRRVNITVEGHEVVRITPRAHDQTVIHVRQHAEATVVEQSMECTTYIFLEPNAKLRYITHSESSTQRFVYLEQHAQLVWTDVAFNGMRSENTIYLAGDGANARFGSVFLGKNAEECRQVVSMIHKGSRTSSHMLTRAVMLDNSKGAYRGLIRILPDAKGCDAFQREDALLLGDHSRMDAVPVLEISNDDVRCSHGVTLGQIDEEQLFYVQSRGLSRADAISMMVQGFFDQMLIAMGEMGEPLRKQLQEVHYG